MRFLRVHSVTGFIVFALASCGEAPQRISIETSRDVATADSMPKLNASSSERFGLGSSPSTSAGAQVPASGLVWKTPPGWVELTTSAMRSANFQVAGNPRSECYLTLLAGEAGGLAANINRWRTQMSLPVASADEIAALPHGQLLGHDAVEVDFTGSFTGMNGDQGAQGYRLVGLLAVEPSGSAFLKMVGPENVVGSQVDAFRALARSFGSADAAHGAPHSDGAVPSGDASDPSHSDAAGGIRWQLPAGWRRAPERATRTASFFIGGGSDVECYVTILSGDGGGPLANVNRWAKQLGRDEMSADDLAALPHIPMLGGQGISVEIQGSSQGTGPETLLLGAVASLDDRALFVKLVGPRDRVASEREAFKAFCTSLSAAH